MKHFFEDLWLHIKDDPGEAFAICLFGVVCLVAFISLVI